MRVFKIIVFSVFFTAFCAFLFKSLGPKNRASKNMTVLNESEKCGLVLDKKNEVEKVKTPEKRPKKVIKLKNFEKNKKPNHQSDFFKVGDVLKIDVNSGELESLKDLLESNNRTVDYVFYKGQFVEKDAMRRLPLNESFVYVSDIKPLLNFKKDEMGIVMNHFILTSGFSKKYLCLEPLVEEKDSIRPISYLDGNPCPNFVYIHQNEHKPSIFGERLIKNDDDFLKRLSFDKIQKAFGDEVELSLISCSSKSTSQFESVCPKKLKQPEVRLTKLEAKML